MSEAFLGCSSSTIGCWLIDIDALKKNLNSPLPRAVQMMSKLAFIITEDQMTMVPPNEMPSETASYVVKSQWENTIIEATDKNGKKEELSP